MSLSGLTGRSSALRLFGSIIDFSGILDHPHARVMTTEYTFAISRRIASEIFIFVCPPMRAQGRPGACCTRGLACDFAHSKNGTRAYRAAGAFRPSLRNGFYGLLRALPGERLFCLRYPKEASLLQNVMPAPRHQNHTTSPYAGTAHVSRSSRVHRISPRGRDVRERPSSAVRRAELCR